MIIIDHLQDIGSIPIASTSNNKRGMMIEIKNLKNDIPQFEYDARVDRYANEILGNHIGKGYPRAKSIQLFTEWIDSMISKNDNTVMGEIERLHNIHQKHGNLRLFCWCYPQPCHAEVIANRIRRLYLYKYI